MAAAVKPSLSKTLDKIASLWAIDPFRPHVQCQTFLRSLATHPKLTSEAVEAARALQSNVMMKKVPSSRDCSSNVDLRSQFPLSEKIRRPASMPFHYDRVVAGMEKSAQGIGRPWWKVLFNVW